MTVDDDEILRLIEKMVKAGHVVYHPDDLHLPVNLRRLKLTEDGRRWAEIVLGVNDPRP